MVLILLGNTCIGHSLKFELISHKIGLVFSAMEHDTRRLLCCLACDCNYRCDEKLHIVNFKSKTVYYFKNSWRFLKLHMYSQIKTFIIIITRIFIQDNLSVLIKRTVIKRVL